VAGSAPNDRAFPARPCRAVLDNGRNRRLGSRHGTCCAWFWPLRNLGPRGFADGAATGPPKTPAIWRGPWNGAGMRGMLSSPAVPQDEPGPSRPIGKHEGHLTGRMR